MAKPTSVLTRAIVLMSLALTCSLAAAAPRLIFRSVHYAPKPARPGEIIRISFDVRIEDGPMTPTAQIEEVPRRPGPPPPTFVLGRLESGDHTIDVFRYTVPDTPPERVCFRIALPGGALRDACLKRIRGAGGRWMMDVDTPGYWTEVPPAPTAAPSPGGSGTPDLKMVGNISTQSTVTLQNVGTGPATNVSVRKACFLDGVWRSVGGDREFRTIDAHAQVILNVGKLGNDFGLCPPGSTRVRVAADPGNRIAELDENNNAVETTPLPDLVLTAFTIPYVAGSGHRLRFSVTNAGGADVGRFTWELRVLQKGVMGKFRESTIAGLAAGQSTNVDVPAGSGIETFGGAYANLVLDPSNAIVELDETNNTRPTNVQSLPRR